MSIFHKKENASNILTKIEKKYKVRRYIELVIGILLVALAYNIFLLPNDIVFGGVSGLAIIVKKIITLNPSTFIMISSVILLFISYIFLGKDQTKGSIVGSILFPILVNLTANINQYINIDTSNILLSVIFGGILYGFGAGLVFKAGFTTGGTDVINQIISKYFHVSMGNAMLMSDGLIVLAGGFFFGITKLMYAIIVVYIIGIMTDKVLLGISNSKAFYIITNEDEKIRDYLINELHHGVTIFSVKGGYTHKKDEVILCVVPTNEYYRVKEGIREIDEQAFFVICDAYEVFGGE
ncbi:MAG: YitT family protein [Tenericutes bacterium]|nr:YitT family protein [Mycoplasmatota bacterium]